MRMRGFDALQIQRKRGRKAPFFLLVGCMAWRNSMRMMARRTSAAREPVAARPRALARPPFLGNQSRLRGMQTKLTIGAVNDPLEHEADAVSEIVMRMPDPVLSVSASPLQVSRKCAVCEEEEGNTKLWKKSAGPPSDHEGAAPPIVQEALRTGGQPLDAALRAFMETRFDHDFGEVRIHSHALGEESANAVGARAYTVGGDIVFGKDAYSPGSDSGRRLIAHELAHVVQEGGAGSARSAPASATLRRDPVYGPPSPDFTQGYQDGAAGEPSHAISRAGDALLDYD